MGVKSGRGNEPVNAPYPRAPGESRPVDRPAQRRRTRKAIVDAAIALIRSGRTPSVAEVASAADVSRRTIYLYFPTFEQLLLDATVGAMAQHPVDQAIDAARDDQDVEARVIRMVRALNDVSPEVERLGRALVRLSLGTPTQPTDRDPRRRGYRRIEWIETALAPWRAVLGRRRWKRLVAALAMIAGWEALIVQRDVLGLSASEGTDVAVWAARALLDAALRETGASGRTRARARP